MSSRTDSVYGWWSRHQRLFRALSWVAFGGREDELRRRSVDALDLSGEERVLDLACGAGVNFDRLAGEVVGVDATAGMVQRARERARTVPSLRVVRGDAAKLPLADGSVDAAYSSLSLSAVPDHVAAIDETYRVLASGGRFSVLDARPIQTFEGRLLNPLLNPISAWATNWHPDRDVVGAIRERFDAVEVESFNRGTFFVAVATKR